MKNLLKVSIALFVAMTLGACGNGKNGTNEAEPAKKTVTVDSQSDSEELALAGEQLLNPATFMLADKTLTMALEKDPDNKRAQFYKMFLKRIMTLKGIGSRVRPWVREHGDIGSFESSAQKFPNSPLKDFLYKGKEDIKTTTQLQDVLVEYRNALVEYYGWLKKNQDLVITLNLNPFVFQHTLREDELNVCQVIDKPTVEGRLEVECDYTEIAQRKVNAADMIAIRQYVAGEILYFTLFTAYTAEGTERLIRLNKKGNMTGDQVVDLLTSNSEFGKLRKDNTLSIIKSLGADLIGAWKWAMDNQRALCQYGDPAGDVNAYGKPKNRKGFLAENGLCVVTGSEAEKNVRLAEQALEGAVKVDFEDARTGQKKSVMFDPLAFTRKPVTDLRTVQPTKFDKCNRPTAFKDPTLGGIYPTGNAAEMVTEECAQ